MSGNYMLVSTRNFPEGYGMEIKYQIDGNFTTTQFDFRVAKTISDAIKRIGEIIATATRDTSVTELLLLVHGFNVDGGSFQGICERYSGLFGKKYFVVGFDWKSIPAVDFNLDPAIATVDGLISSLSWFDPRRALLNTVWVPLKNSVAILDMLKNGFAYASTSELAMDESHSLYYVLIAILCETELKLTILAHSLGSRVLLGALKEIAHDHTLTSVGTLSFFGDAAKPVMMANLQDIDAIVFKEGDRDYDLFLHNLRYLRERGLNAPIYSFGDKADGALKGSALLHGTVNGAPIGERLGQVDTQTKELSDLKVIVHSHANATKFDKGDLTAGFQLRHSYFDDDLDFQPTLKKILDGELKQKVLNLTNGVFPTVDRTMAM